MSAALLVIRADATTKVGVGHVLRCLSVAQAWRSMGGKTLFAGNIDAPTLRERLRREGHGLIAMSPDALEDTDILMAATRSGDWIMVDGYHFTPALTHALRQAGRRVLAVSDGPGQPTVHEQADALLNTGYGAELMDYATTPECLRLMGPEYALLRSEFPEAGRRRAPEPAEAGRLLLTFGGADSARMTERAAGMLAAEGLTDVECRIVVGQANPRAADIAAIYSGYGVRAEVLMGCDDMAALMDWADLGFASGGVTALEMAAAGLPAVLVPVADNQRPNTEGLVRSGAAESPGGLDVSDAAVVDMLLRLRSDRDRRQAMSDAGRRYVDGRGGSRVAAILRGLAGIDAVDAVLRPAHLSDLMQYFHLANDPLVRAQSFSPGAIDLETHRKWFHGRVQSDSTAMFVLEYQGVVMAQARYDLEEGVGVVDVSVHPAFRGRGMGVRMLLESCQPGLKRLQVKRLRATVLEGNPASAACFLKAGFTEREACTVGGQFCRVFEYGESV